MLAEFITAAAVSGIYLVHDAAPYQFTLLLLTSYITTSHEIL